MSNQHHHRDTRHRKYSSSDESDRHYDRRQKMSRHRSRSYSSGSSYTSKSYSSRSSYSSHSDRKYKNQVRPRTKSNNFDMAPPLKENTISSPERKRFNSDVRIPSLADVKLPQMPVNLGSLSIGTIISILRLRHQKISHEQSRDNSVTFFPHLVLEPQSNQYDQLPDFNKRQKKSGQGNMFYIQEALEASHTIAKQVPTDLVDQVKSERLTGAAIEELDSFEKWLQNRDEKVDLKKKYEFDYQRDVKNFYQTVKSDVQKHSQLNQGRDKQKNEVKNNSLTQMFQAETNVGSDGRAGSSRNRAGLGAARSDPFIAENKASVSGVTHTQTGAGDAFDRFRTQRSTKYHVAAESRQKDAAQTFHKQQVQQGRAKSWVPQGKNKDIQNNESSDKCYICQKVGHQAKHCKFGIS